MKDFNFYSPTEVFFGKGYLDSIADLIQERGFKRVLIVYGGGSIKKSGLYDKVVTKLDNAGIFHCELGGVQPNPLLALAKEGIALSKAEKCDLILAVGGGSAIDTAKVIGLGSVYDGDVWDFWCGKAKPAAHIPVATILTIAAAGSETSQSAVITNEDGMQKKGIDSEFNRPLFSIMDPQLTYTLPKYQTACGIVDIMMHTIERYITRRDEFEITDRIAEAILKTVVHWGPIAIAEPENYEARANIMWAGSLSHNDLTGCGRDKIMINHKLGHELSALYGVAHGASLSIMLPAWMKYNVMYNIPRFAQFANRVFNIDYDFANPENTARAGIVAVESFFKAIGVPTRLSDVNISEDQIDNLADRVTQHDTFKLCSYTDCGKAEIKDIYKMAL